MPVPPIQQPLNGNVSSCGPVQATITPLNLLNLILNMTPDECLQVTTKLGCISSASAGNANNVWDSIYAQGIDALAVPLSKTLDNGYITTEATTAAAGEASSLQIVPQASGAGLLFILANAEVNSFVGCDCGLFTLSVPDCNPANEPLQIIIPEQQLQVPGLPGSNYHEGNAWQTIINMLVDLRSRLEDYRSVATYKLVSTITDTSGTTPINPFTGDTIGALKLFVSANPDPARINWQPPADTVTGGVQRFGKVVFTSVIGEASPVYFWNVQNQVFIPPFATASATVYTNEGVELVALYKTPSMCDGTQTALQASH